MGKSDKVSYGKILFFACLSLIISACGSGEASAPEAQIVRVVDDEFSPKLLRVPVGVPLFGNLEVQTITM